jgi:hypothetical protein
MPRDFFDPTPEQQNVVLVDAAILQEAERMIESCEGCNPDGAEIPFDNILDRVTRSDPSVTDYVLESPAKCPNCRREFLEMRYSPKFGQGPKVDFRCLMRQTWESTEGSSARS